MELSKNNQVGRYGKGKKKKVKKPKVSKYENMTTAQVKNLARTNYQRYVRLRDTDHNGNGYCISCGKPIKWNNCDAGHMISRKYEAVFFDERNCNAQCKFCNQHLYGNAAEYREKLDCKYGEGTYKELFEAKNKIVKRTKNCYIALNELYLMKCKELKKPL